MTEPIPESFLPTRTVLEAFDRVTSLLVSAGTSDRVLRQILGCLCEDLGYDGACLHLVARRSTLEPLVSLGETAYPGTLMVRGASPPARAVQTRRPQVVPGPWGIEVYVPVSSHERVVAVLGARRGRPGEPGVEEILMLRILAHHVGLVLENQALHEANESRIRHLLAVQRVSREMTSTLDLDQLLGMVVNEALDLTGGEAGALYLLEPGGERLRLAAWAGAPPAREEIPVGYGISGWVAHHGRPLRVTDAGSEDAGYASRKNHLAVPLLSEGRVVGTLSLEAGGDRPFTPTHEEVLGIFAAQAAKAIEASRFLRQIREERDLRDGILSGTPNGVISVDARRRVALMNPAARRVLEVSEDPEGQPLERYLSEPAFLEGLRRVLGGESSLEEVPVTRGTGPGACHLLLSVFPLGEGASRGATVIVQDLTERRRLDEGVQRMARLASIGQLAAGIAHEIRNPLTGMAISLDILREEEGMSEAGRGLVEDIHREIDRLESLIRGLLDFARPQPVEARPMRVAKALEWHRTFEKQCREKGVTLTVDLGPNPKVQGDPEKLKQLFLNLAINALEATPPGGRIRIEARRLAGTPWVRVIVEDTGSGMDPEILAQVFDPFFTTKHEGTGLGLSIAHSIVDQHGGRIDAESEPGRGTRFTVDLPAADADGQEASSPGRCTGDGAPEPADTGVIDG